MATEFMVPGENLHAALVSPPQAPDESVGSFLVKPPRPRVSLAEAAGYEHRDYLQHPAYDAYLRMHKVIVNKHGAEQLEHIYEALCQEAAPRYLQAAGWAAAEAALVRRDKSVEDRLGLLDAGVAAWRQAVTAEHILETLMPSDKIECETPLRIQLNIATAPLLADMIAGEVSPDTCRAVFEDYLNIADLAAAGYDARNQAHDRMGRSYYVGFGHELNALLAFNRTLSPTWFAIPAPERADSGYHHPQQTHDLLIIHQKYGVIKSATPVEIKAKASLRDRKRYDALLVRGKMHLSVEGKFLPKDTLRALTAAHRGDAVSEDQEIADNATDTLVSMVRDYYAGKALGKIAGRHTVTVFRNSDLVAARHPGLSKVALAS